VFVDFLSYNTFCHLRLIYHMRLVLGDYRDFSCKMSLATKIWLQTLVENTQFSSSVMACSGYCCGVDTWHTFSTRISLSICTFQHY